MNVFPVIHVQSTKQAVEQSVVAAEAEADGVFLIDHGVVGALGLLEAFEQVRAAAPLEFVGLNLLNGGPRSAYAYVAEALGRGRISDAPSAIWVDDARSGHDPAGFSRWRTRRCPELSDVRHYGGLAFKYTPTYTDDPEAAAAEVASFIDAVDIPTTSGPATGHAPPIEKLRAMKAAAGPKPLAVASGISLENLMGYARAVDEILVASSVEITPYSGRFDSALLEKFVALAHSLETRGPGDRTQAGNQGSARNLS